MHKKIIAFAVGLLAVGIIGSVITAEGYFSEEEQLETKEFTPDEVHTITIDTDLSTIEFLPSGSDKILVESFYGKNKKPAEVKTDQSTLHIKAKQHEYFHLGFNWKNKNLKVVVHLPKKNFNHITINNDVGSTNLTEVDTKSLTVNTDAGSVKLDRIGTDTMDVSSEIGSITVHDSTGDMALKSETGSIKVQTDALDHHLNASTELGSIKVTTRQSPEDIFITAQSELGSIRILGEKTNSYKHGNAAFETKLVTETGSIRVEQE